MPDLGQTKIVIAAYGVPGIMAVEGLFAFGLMPHQLFVVTYGSDERNRPFLEFLGAHDIETVDVPARSDEAFEWMRKIQPDALFSFHYRHRIPARLLDLPLYGCINLHPSLLPHYRGCFSAPWVIINGEETTGYTYHRMVEGFDAGNVILQERIPVRNEDTGFSLFHRLIVEGIKSFEKVFVKAVVQHDKETPQPDGGSYYPRQVPHGGAIDPSWDKSRVDRFIRAMQFPPYKGAIVDVAGNEVEVTSLEEYRRVTSCLRSQQ